MDIKWALHTDMLAQYLKISIVQEVWLFKSRGKCINVTDTEKPTEYHIRRRTLPAPVEVSSHGQSH